MKTFFEEPILRVVTFEAKDILTNSNTDPDLDENELPFVPVDNP